MLFTLSCLKQIINFDTCSRSHFLHISNFVQICVYTFLQVHLYISTIMNHSWCELLYTLVTCITKVTCIYRVSESSQTSLCIYHSFLFIRYILDAYHIQYTNFAKPCENVNMYFENMVRRWKDLLMIFSKNGYYSMNPEWSI